MKAIGKGSLASFITVLLDIGWYGGFAFMALMVCVLLATPWLNPPAIEVGLAVPVAFTLNAETRAAEQAPGAVNVHVQNAEGKLYFSPRSRAVAAEGIAGFIVVLALGMFVVGTLRQIFRTLRAGTPFVAANATRIRRIGWLMIAGGLLNSFFFYFGSLYASTHFATPGVRYDTRISLTPYGIVCGLIVLVIAEVFREGTRLDEEQSLTV